MMEKLLLATSGARALMMLLAAEQATTAVSAAQGQPAMDRNVDFGDYTWYDGNRIPLCTTDRGNGPALSEYNGTITAHSTRSDPAAIISTGDQRYPSFPAFSRYAHRSPISGLDHFEDTVRPPDVASSMTASSPVLSGYLTRTAWIIAHAPRYPPRTHGRALHARW